MFLYLIFLFGCIKEKAEYYSCYILEVMTIKDRPDIKPDSSYVYSTHYLTADECIIMKDINTYSTSFTIPDSNNIIDVQYIMKCK